MCGVEIYLEIYKPSFVVQPIQYLIAKNIECTSYAVVVHRGVRDIHRPN